jgi:hypothetical protein
MKGKASGMCGDVELVVVTTFFHACGAYVWLYNKECLSCGEPINWGDWDGEKMDAVAQRAMGYAL